MRESTPAVVLATAKLALTPDEEKIIQAVRETEYGEVTVVVTGGKVSLIKHTRTTKGITFRAV